MRHGQNIPYIRYMNPSFGAALNVDYQILYGFKNLYIINIKQKLYNTEPEPEPIGKNVYKCTPNIYGDIRRNTYYPSENLFSNPGCVCNW